MTQDIRCVACVIDAVRAAGLTSRVALRVMPWMPVAYCTRLFT